MMISPEWYYEEHLKGKSKEQIMTSIRGLKQRIGSLKNSMENPYEDIKIFMHPSEETQLYWTREYLKMAKQAYAEAGGTYILSESEARAAEFDENIYSISKITFRVKKSADIFHKYVIEVLNDIITLSEFREHGLIKKRHKKNVTKTVFLYELKNLHIGEWRRRYSAKHDEFNVLNITKWEVEFEYSNEFKPKKFGGENAYPYNFDRFQMLFEVD
ncbi:hypothetical protein [Bacillus daqingensis]|uniref:hypothetical protein n=1 Tax=Bacillus daqingensis TaxID=872396 RepID=UPI003F836737